jgi:hypothetical protein
MILKIQNLIGRTWKAASRAHLSDNPILNEQAAILYFPPPSIHGYHHGGMLDQ